MAKATPKIKKPKPVPPPSVTGVTLELDLAEAVVLFNVLGIVAGRGGGATGKYIVNVTRCLRETLGGCDSDRAAPNKFGFARIASHTVALPEVTETALASEVRAARDRILKRSKYRGE